MSSSDWYSENELVKIMFLGPKSDALDSFVIRWRMALFKTWVLLNLKNTIFTRWFNKWSLSS